MRAPIVALVLLAAVPSASAMQLCVRKDPATGGIRENARITLRTVCRPSEVPLPLSLEAGNSVLRITGVNVQIVDGSGDTGGTPNGRGNLIIGYDEGRCLADPEEDAPCVSDADCTGTWGPPCHREDKTGSHNLVVGPGHRYTGTGAVVAGSMNEVRGGGSVAIGGSLNGAAGGAVALGGFANVADTAFAVGVGGYENRAGGPQAVVVGGSGNEAVGLRSIVAGGVENTTVEVATLVAGGNDSRAEAPQSAILGGASKTASAAGEVIVGP